MCTGMHLRAREHAYKHMCFTEVAAPPPVCPETTAVTSSAELAVILHPPRRLATCSKHYQISLFGARPSPTTFCEDGSMVTYELQLPELNFRCVWWLSNGLPPHSALSLGRTGGRIVGYIYCVFNIWVGGIQTLAVAHRCRCTISCRMHSNSCLGTFWDPRYEQMCKTCILCGGRIG